MVSSDYIHIYTFLIKKYLGMFTSKKCSFAGNEPKTKSVKHVWQGLAILIDASLPHNIW